MSEFDLEKYNDYKEAYDMLKSEDGEPKEEKEQAENKEHAPDEKPTTEEPKTVTETSKPAAEEKAPEEPTPEKEAADFTRLGAIGREDSVSEKPNKKNKKNKDSVTGAFEWVESSVFAVVVVILLFTFVFRIVGIDGSSMVPTLQNADRVIISNLFYTPKTGDIVVLDTSEDMIFFNGKQYSKPLIKRVIATGGQSVEVSEVENGVQTVKVDGVPLKEDYINFLTVRKSAPQREMTVPEGYVFVMGDNRGESLDSRVFGCINGSSIVGRAVFRIFPLSEMGTFN